MRRLSKAPIPTTANGQMGPIDANLSEDFTNHPCGRFLSAPLPRIYLQISPGTGAPLPSRMPLKCICVPGAPLSSAMLQYIRVQYAKGERSSSCLCTIRMRVKKVSQKAKQTKTGRERVVNFLIARLDRVFMHSSFARQLTARLRTCTPLHREIPRVW
jgi:hypothetical protein